MIRTLILTLLTTPLFAHDCVQQVVVPQQVFVPTPIVYFQAGSQLRIEALAKKSLQQDPEYQEFLEFKKWKSRNTKAASTTPSPQTQVIQAKSILQSNCAQCHASNPPAGRFAFDGTKAVDSKQFEKIVTWMSGKAQPPGKMAEVVKKLIDERKTADVLSELIDLQMKGKEGDSK